MKAIVEWWQSIWSGSTAYTCGQVIGLFCMLWYIVIYLPEKRTTILKLKMVNDVLYTVQNALIGATMGMVLNGLMIAREVVFLYRGTKKWASHIVWLPIFLVIVGISPSISILTGQEPVWLAIIPAVGSMIAVMAYFQMDANNTRYLVFPANIPWFVYYILAHNLGGALTMIISNLSILVAIIVHWSKKRKSQAEASTKEMQSYSAALEEIRKQITQEAVLSKKSTINVDFFDKNDVSS